MPNVMVQRPFITIPPTLATIMERLNGLAETRIVGGMVRNAVIAHNQTTGQKASPQNIAKEKPATASVSGCYHADDSHYYDLAIATTPKQLHHHASQFDDWRLVLDGFSHGIIRIISAGMMVEVACLRRDVSTDGRHAVVAFTTDWLADAARRDFTINSLYADHQGRIIDSLNIMDDFFPLRLRFIGDSEQRIKEDYLRILRYYRFLATLPIDSDDNTNRMAIKKHRGELARLSPERVGGELIKIFLADPRDDGAPRPLTIMRMMLDDGIWSALRPTVESPIGFTPAAEQIKKLDAFIPIINRWPAPRRAVFYYRLIDQTGHHYKKLAFPKSINHLLRSLYIAEERAETPFAIHYHHGTDVFHIHLLRQRLTNQLSEQQWHKLSQEPQPHFPLKNSGQDLQHLGYEKKHFMLFSKELEHRWLESNGQLDKPALLAIAKELMDK